MVGGDLKTAFFCTSLRKSAISPFLNVSFFRIVRNQMKVGIFRHQLIDTAGPPIRKRNLPLVHHAFQERYTVEGSTALRVTLSLS
jgi:hypothetical protein